MAAVERRKRVDASGNLAGISAGQCPRAVVTALGTIVVRLPQVL